MKPNEQTIINQTTLARRSLHNNLLPWSPLALKILSLSKNPNPSQPTTTTTYQTNQPTWTPNDESVAEEDASLQWSSIDPTASGFEIIEASPVVLVGVTFPTGLGAKIFSIVKADVGEDIVAEELGLEPSRGLYRVSSVDTALLENCFSRISPWRLPLALCCSSVLFSFCCRLSGE